VAPLQVVKPDPLGQPLSQLGTAVEGMQVQVMVFEGPPEPLDKDVVPALAPSVHADGDVVILEHLSETVTDKLTALVGVEDFRPAMAAEGLLKGLNTEIRVQGIGKDARTVFSGCTSP